MSNYDSESTPDLGGEQAGRILRFSPLQRELLHWLEQYAPPMVEPYMAAMTLLEGRASPGRVTLVCFCMRDLGNLLPQARQIDEIPLNPSMPIPDELNGFKRKVTALSEALQKLGASQGEPVIGTLKEINDLSQWIGRNPIAVRPGDSDGSRRKAKSLLRALPQRDVTDKDASRWVDEVYDLLKWFEKHHHFSHKQRSWPSDEELTRNVQRFERLLLKFTHTFFGLMRTAEQIIARVSAQGGMPTQSDADHLVDVLNWSPEFQRPLLDILSPAWVQALNDRQIFADPPPANYWPAATYLARIAPDCPAEVVAIFAKIETDNPTVIGDMLKAAQAMPLDYAVSFVPAVCRAAKKDKLWIYFKNASDFCVRLAEGDHTDVAMKLAQVLFTPSFENGQEKRNRGDQHWSKEGLKKVVPILARRKSRDFLPMLCDWLVVSIEAKKQVDRDAAFSYLWRPAIEEHEQNRDYDFTGVMVGFVREGFENALDSGSLSLEAALEIVERYPQVIFKRIKLHLIGEFADQYAELARETILNRQLFDDYQYKHEYARLVGGQLDLLSPEQRDAWFGWIDAGPDMSDFDQSMKNLGRAVPTEEDRKAWIEDWQFEKLHWVRAHLEGARRDFYERMLSQRGEPALADMNVHMSSGFMGDESPITVEQLITMTFEQVVDAISSWRPGRLQFRGPSITGLESAFEHYVATKPEEFSTKARILIDQPAIFVRGFLHQISESIKAGCQIDLSAVLDLCDWVVKRPIEERTTCPEMDDRSVDHSWQWTRDEIARLIETACAARGGDGPRYALDGFRQRMWRLIASLCHDSAESYIVHDSAKEDPRLQEYLGFAINSPRGKAVAAALEYARWVANHFKKDEGKLEIIADGFNAMPEVREMLAWQIAQDNRTFEALAVIGSRIGLVYWIDKQWLAKNTDSLFALEDIEIGPAAAHGWAAWNAFLVWVSPHIEFYRIFKSQFAYAVEEAARVKLAERNPEQPMHHLGEHLMLVYGRGQLGLDDDGCMLRRFVENANPDVRRHAIGFIGQSLQGDEKIPKEFIERFQALWDLYWAGPGRKDAEETPTAWLFGGWFSSGKFPESWALERLQQFVEVNSMPEPDHAIAEKLAEMAHVDTARAVRIHDRMVRGDREGWRLEGWRDSAKRILHVALSTPGEAREVALSLVDYLGRRGYTDFGRLL